MKQLRYTGSFLSRNGIAWRVDILQEAAAPFQTVGELTFPSDHPLVIEWAKKAKHEPVCGSTATLRIESPGDRTYLDLYTVRAGDIRMEVYRGNDLYWAGSLDTEFYEEPYSRGRNYDVELTFADLGILDRKKYELSGTQTYAQIIRSALNAAGFTSVGVIPSISTTFVEGTPVTLDSLAVMSANFIDEDEVRMTYKEALEGILQPLALKIIQKNGRFHVFDINALMDGAASDIEWDGTDSRLGTDSVYNNIKVTFSPYSRADVADGSVDYNDTFGPEWTNLDGTVKYNGGAVPSGMTAPDCHSFYLNAEEAEKDSPDQNLVGFTIFTSRDTSRVSGVQSLGNGAYYYRIQPVLSGSDEAGITWGFRWRGETIGGFVRDASEVFTTRRVYIPKLDEASRKEYYIRIRQELLWDCRYNPFETPADKSQEKKDYDAVSEKVNLAHIPVSVVVKDESGSALCHWTNRSIVQNGHPADSIAGTAGSWEYGAGSFGASWLAYYDGITSGSGVLGWKCNRQEFGNPIWGLPGMPVVYIDPDVGGLKVWRSTESFKRSPDGQFIPYPPEGGYLEMTVYSGVWAFPFGEQFDVDEGRISQLMGWTLYHAPEMTIVKRNLNYTSAGMDDIEYSGMLDENAKDELDISTIVGTSDDFNPSARGLLLKSDGENVVTLTRAGVTDHPEQLLIGTLYSQHAARHTVLTGEAVLNPGSLRTFTDVAQPEGTRFLMTGEIQNIRENTASVTLVELSADNYKGQ